MVCHKGMSFRGQQDRAFESRTLAWEGQEGASPTFPSPVSGGFPRVRWTPGMSKDAIPTRQGHLLTPLQALSYTSALFPKKPLRRAEGPPIHHYLSPSLRNLQGPERAQPSSERGSHSATRALLQTTGISAIGKGENLTLTQRSKYIS